MFVVEARTRAPAVHRPVLPTLAVRESDALHCPGKAAVTEFLTRATVTPPEGLTASGLVDLRRREAQRAAELAAEGRLVRAWRPHASQEWANICLWRAQDEGDLWAQLESLPFFPYMSIKVQQLDTHPSDPQRPGQNRPQPS